MIAVDAVEWSEPFQDSDNLDMMLKTRISGRKVLARLTQEAIEDKGFTRSKALAEQKLRAALKADRVPHEIVVKTNDFPRA